MKRETQADRLAKLMYNHSSYPEYELTLSSLLIEKKILKKLSVKDVLVLGKKLQLHLSKEGKLLAKGELITKDKRYFFQICKLIEVEPKVLTEKKYETLHFSFGTVQSKELKVGYAIDLVQVDLDKIVVKCQGQTIVEGLLVEVEGKIAVKIEKVKIEKVVA